MSPLTAGNTGNKDAEVRIVHVVCTSEFAGVERSLTYVAPELARRGHDVTVIGGAPQRMAAPLAAQGVTFIPADSIIGAIKALRAVSLARTDVVHSHMTAADIASVLSRPRVHPLRVSTLHFAQPRGRTAIRRRAYRLLPAHIDVQISISQYVAERCETPTVVIPNGIPDPGCSSSDRDPVVLMAQRLEPEKDTAVAIEAWAHCPLAQQGWELHIAGDGSERPALAERVRQLGLDDSVRLLGFVDDVHARMTRASIFLTTAVDDGFGLAIVEAMADGLPVIAANGGAHSEVLASTGTLFLPSDAKALGQVLTNVAADPAGRTATSAAQRSRYESHYTISHHVDALLLTYGTPTSADRVGRRGRKQRTPACR